MSAAADVARMLTLVPWLLERPGASLAETAAAFGVTEATIRTDLGHLDFCGLPGLGGGALFEVTLVEDRVVLRMADELRRPLRPTPEEALRLVVTVDAVAEALAEELPPLASAVTRIRAALGIPERSADVVTPEGTAALSPFRAAIRDARVVTLQYQGRGDQRPRARRVDPWALHVVQGSWYLQGFDHQAGDRRVFRLDRVANAEVTDEPATHPAPSELEPPRYQPGPDDLEVELTVTARGRWVADALVLDEVRDGPDGGARFRLRTDAPRWLAGVVLMAGGEVEVTAPASLRTLVADLAEEAANAAGE